MLYVSFPTGAFHGWGVLGKNLAMELAELTDIRLLTENFTPEAMGGELDFHAMQRLLPAAGDVSLTATDGPDRILNGKLLTAVDTVNMAPRVPNLRGEWTVGYTVFEDMLVKPQAIENSRWYDHLAAGSSACEERLRQGGLTNVTTVIHGIDPTIFEPTPVERRYLRDRFVVFSGGKLELRKGQDVVVRAFKALQDKHDDVMLVCAWNNPWPKNAHSIKSSRLTRFDPTSDNQITMATEYLSQNGIDLRRALVLSARPNLAMAHIFKQTDIGIFPNRCEGGTNLVLMEYMACGKPVIASYSSGHRDIITNENSLPLRQLRQVPIAREGKTVAYWDEPDLDEAIAKLEYAYLNRAALGLLARRAGEDLKLCTWRHTAEKLFALTNLQA
jgi:glycosyltransferase involved in cell wall biosynthesis